MNEAEPRGNAGNPGNANLPIGRGEAANQEIGAPGEAANREIGAPWHSRGYLPHFESADAIQHVTWHLADSLPKEVVARLDEELKALPPKKQDAERRKRIEAWLDAGHGSCVLREPTVAAMVQNAFLFFDAQRYRLLAWVVMPNHVHVLFQPLHNWTVAKIVASWKKFTATQICAHLRNAGNAPGNANLLIGRGEAANQEIGAPRGAPAPVWHREYWDRYMRNETHFAQALEYIRQNPVKAGLVVKAEDWLWSSAGNAHLLIGGSEAANQEIGAPGGAPGGAPQDPVL